MIDKETLKHYNFSNILNVRKTINCRGTVVDIETPRVMGIINITPDSFYSGSRYGNEKDVLNRVSQIVEEGGSMVDIGAYSSRSNAVHISEEEEISRLLPILKTIRESYPSLIISVDTFRSNVAIAAVEEGGADIINDISGGDLDDNMFDTIARLNVPYILMHMQGTPQNMQNNPKYDDIIADVSLVLAKKVDVLRSKGVNDIIVDPGFGFGKTLDDNYELYSKIDEFRLFELPILVGVSRKSMIYNFLGITADEALNGTTVLNTIALQKGTNILRVHDVKEAVETVRIVDKLNSFL